MSKHKGPKTVMRFDHGRENLDQNVVNFISYAYPSAHTTGYPKGDYLI